MQSSRCDLGGISKESKARVSRTGASSKLAEGDWPKRARAKGVGEHRGWRDSRSYADLAYLELADASQSIYLAEAPLDR